MKVIASGRRTGKTAELIKLAATAEKRGEVSYIVCHSHNEAYRISHAARIMGLEIGFPITYTEVIRLSGNSFIKNLFIDNAECFLASLIPYNIEAITVTTEDATG